jgi:hypothetical protein
LIQWLTFILCPGEYRKPEYAGQRVFIDVLCVPQQDVNTEEVVGTTHSNYTNCWTVVFVKGDYLKRAWCCLEIAASTNDDCKITVIGSCDSVSGKDFFDNIIATQKSDVDLIQKEILKLFENKEKFNGVVAKAMEVLFVAAQKKVVCCLYDSTLRVNRHDWQERLNSKNPTKQERNKQQDWFYMTGNLSIDVIANSTSRVVKVFLCSTFGDTVLEWNFFHQDVAPFLKLCARNRGIDLVFVDIRFGNRDEDALREEIVLAELERCKAESSGIFFLLLTCNKYGLRRAPARIPRGEFESLLAKIDSAESDAVRAVYDLDENKLNATNHPAPEYVLKGSLSKRAESLAIKHLRSAAQKQWPGAFDRKLRNNRYTYFLLLLAPLYYS